MPRILESFVTSHGEEAPKSLKEAALGTSRRFTIRYVILGESTNHTEAELLALADRPD